MASLAERRPRVAADGPLADVVIRLLDGEVEWLPWSIVVDGSPADVDAIYTYGHPELNGRMLDGLRGVRVISNYGVGVDHIHVADAAKRGIPVGNTPGILDGATADMAFALLLAAGRRLIEGDLYARSSRFTVYDPGFMLGREIHGATIGILGMGRIGCQIARRAAGFDMRILYHNRRQNDAAERKVGATYVSWETLLAESDYLVISVPLTDETRGMVDAQALKRMKSTATLVNVARGPIVDTAALTEALQNREIHAAALDVTDPEPLPREYPILQLSNLVVAPHLGSATVETRQKMAEISVENLRRGLAGEPLLHEVTPPH